MLFTHSLSYSHTLSLSLSPTHPLTHTHSHSLTLTSLHIPLQQRTSYNINRNNSKHSSYPCNIPHQSLPFPWPLPIVAFSLIFFSIYPWPVALPCISKTFQGESSACSVLLIGFPESLIEKDLHLRNWTYSAFGFRSTRGELDIEVIIHLQPQEVKGALVQFGLHYEEVNCHCTSHPR